MRVERDDDHHANVIRVTQLKVELAAQSGR